MNPTDSHWHDFDTALVPAGTTISSPEYTLYVVTNSTGDWEWVELKHDEAGGEEADDE